MISVDTMRADRLGKAGPDGRSLTPEMDAFAAESIMWSQAYSAANETLFSHAGLFLGALPSTWGPLDYRTFRLSRDAPTLAARLARAGWRTEGVVAGGHLSPVFGIDAGFQRYQTSQRPFASFQETAPAAIDRLRDLADDDRPFFLFIHGYDCHSPYAKPGPLRHFAAPDYSGPLKEEAENPLFWERLTNDAWFPGFNPPPLQSTDAHFLNPAMFHALELHAADPRSARIPIDDADRAFVRGVYDSAVAYADFHVGRVLREIDRLDLDEDTVVVLLSDHGEDLLTHGAVNHRVSLHDENVHVPLVIRLPGAAPVQRSELVSLADLSPALLSLVGATQGPGLEALGRERVRSESMLGERSVRTPSARLRAPDVALLGPRPVEAGAGMELLDAAGQPIAWDDPRGEGLWEALRPAHPPRERAP
jgi:arylsulfatase A-like enzyme